MQKKNPTFLGKVRSWRPKCTKISAASFMTNQITSPNINKAIFQNKISI